MTLDVSKFWESGSMDRIRLDRLISSMADRPKNEPEIVFRELRELGLSPIETIYAAAGVLDMTLPEAKSAIYESSAWRDHREDWYRFQSGFNE
ncbi:hypothetical protein [Actinophytocola xinjiangensis]|uniref:hypothetical protein n=1 Tax=Actinophytocola xinjiangensis TaxID=485602 RepID=UPI0012B8930E|nr:hypothetical protein [Actinophytocola xinjiangensis]